MVIIAITLQMGLQYWWVVCGWEIQLNDPVGVRLEDTFLNQLFSRIVDE